MGRWTFYRKSLDHRKVFTVNKYVSLSLGLISGGLISGIQQNAGKLAVPLRKAEVALRLNRVQEVAMCKAPSTLTLYNTMPQNEFTFCEDDNTPFPPQGN